jgi:hypothetical protein
MDELPMSNRQVVVLGLKFVQSLLKPLHFRRFLASFIAGDIISGSGARLGTTTGQSFPCGQPLFVDVIVPLERLARPRLAATHDHLRDPSA